MKAGTRTTTAAATPTPVRTGLGSGRTSEELAAVREWARACGHQVADAGVIRKQGLEDYDAAHRAPVRKAGRPMAADAIVLDGYLDEETVPGDLHGSTTRFRLIVSPTDEVMPWSVADPELAHAVTHDLVPGDKLRVTGHLRLPCRPDEPMWLAVAALTVLETAPLLSEDPKPHG